jgi:hypothetical protein
LALAAKSFILLIAARRPGKAMEPIAKLLTDENFHEGRANNSGAERPLFF